MKNKKNFICFDEFDPLEISPQLGKNWRKEPDKIPATYHRDKGLYRYLFVALDSEKIRCMLI